MIAGIFHQGSGLGNQLHRYVMIRCLALDKGLDFGMKNPENFKGSSFMNLDMGLPVPENLYEYCELKVTNDQGVDVRSYDWNMVLHLHNNCLVDGEFQGELYFHHHLDEINDWLKVEPMKAEDDVCIINFRGGEYVGVSDLFLPKSYWEEAMEMMRGINPSMRFQVHTDDPETAVAFFPDLECIHDVGRNWRSIRYAKYSIISNSSFAILPRLLRHNDDKLKPIKDDAVTIAPRNWARRNTGVQAMGYNKYIKFTHI